ncbi:hypothetical protein BFV95_4331 [Alteromonas macleodii]|uniref:Uncharacterized protein n=2 Tax=Alteromonas macleodii TaxID=28108 RepID=A0AB36FNJ5_ALTMA|nr:hypothetical protein BFV95_4331 [Alteromonas macleodii]
MIDDFKVKIRVFIEKNCLNKCQVIYMSEDIPAIVIFRTNEELPKVAQDEFHKLVSDFFPFHRAKFGELSPFSCLVDKYQFVEIGSGYKRKSTL